MEEGSRGGNDGASSSSPLLTDGGRQRFEVELRPGETTIVSWKKLVKDANKAARNNKSLPVPAPTVAVNQTLDSLNAPPLGESAENKANDAPHGSRFSAVIEKIERLYMGKNSSDEEDLNDVPDDDKYDTGDSFIDDAELDEYFQVDNSAIKHDGFFVNRGKLERTVVTQNETTALPSQQPKKRRKDSAKVYGCNDDGQMNNLKVNNKAAGKVVALVDKNFTISSQSKSSSTINFEDIKYQDLTTALETVVKKSSDLRNVVDPSFTSISNAEAIMMTNNIDKQKAGVLQHKDYGSKLQDGSPSSMVQRSDDKSSQVQPKSQYGLSFNNSKELNRSLATREKNVIREQSEAKANEITSQTKKNPLMARKEGSYTKPKSTMLEKAIRDLEKIVVESRPPSMEVADADGSSQAVKRRMPPEIKQKLAKVARLAHAIHGKISKELLNRLMNIVGHLIQLRSLRRNLKNMVNMGLSAKEEKDVRMQQLKKQIDEMVKIRVPMMKSKFQAMGQQVGASDDFQETGAKEKEVLKRRITMDDTLEDKICDLYDLFVEGLDEDSGHQVRKLYAELAELWPQGFMDNHGIRRAICRAKDRRKALHRQKFGVKDQEKLKRKKFVATKSKTLELEGGFPTAAMRSISNTSAAAPNKPKQEKLKGDNNESDVAPSEMLVKRGKRKPETKLCEAQIPQEKTTSAQAEERHKSRKQIIPTVTAAPQPPLT